MAGIKKVSEDVLIEGRALITTDSGTDASGYGDGTLRYYNAKWYRKNGSQWQEVAILDVSGTVESTLRSAANFSIADNSITGSKIKNSSDTDSDRAIGTNHIKDSSITENKIANGSITEHKLGNSSVTEYKLEDGAVTSQKIAFGAIKGDASNSNQSHIEPKSVGGLDIADEAITEEKIAALAIKSKHVDLNAITKEKIAPGAVHGSNKAGGTSKIEYETIGSNDIGESQILSRHIKGPDNDTDAVNGLDGTKLKKASISKSKLDGALKQEIDNSVKVEGIGGTSFADVGPVPGGNYATIKDGATVKVALGTSGNGYFAGDLYAKRVYNAVFNDLAEAYVPGEEIEPGDIVAIREDGKAYKAEHEDKCIVGVCSDCYAACFGATEQELANKEKVAVGLIGKVPVNTVGDIKLGDKIAAYRAGAGRKSDEMFTNYIGKALENKRDDDKKVLCLIYPN